MLPYHSSKFLDADRWLSKLTSVALAKSFVRQFVLPRVERGEAIAVVLRKVRLWELPRIPGVIIYEGKHAQGTHLDSDSAAAARFSHNSAGSDERPDSKIAKRTQDRSEPITILNPSDILTPDELAARLKVRRTWGMRRCVGAAGIHCPQ